VLFEHLPCGDDYDDDDVDDDDEEVGDSEDQGHA
jgi:hypothetical protein